MRLMPPPDGLAGGARGVRRLTPLRQPEAHAAGRGLLGEREQVLGLAAAQGVPHRQGDSVGEPGGWSSRVETLVQVGADDVDEAVDPGSAVGVRAPEPGQPEGRALDGDGGVLLREADDGPSDGAGQRTGALDVLGGELQLADAHDDSP